ncbi:sporulation protein [Actinoplanes derwentensis]|uniref:Sporulation-control protein n=1 Tax=Actinoplanes derwentensis TaxID=113562 RepID=A0A1H1YNH2_9ACTN|nr:sporulation protein [Actinoplanes derwentensis]GID81214.1 sporulation protein [Actinoplanes derwentensis]SDT22789.1 sporulation-control protein [Actinoplanes derwentensis]
MVFKKMLGAFGVGGPSVDTVLSQPGAQPGASVTGQVNLVGGSSDAAIEHITLGLVTRMEVEHGGGDQQAVGEFHRLTVSGPMRLGSGQHLSLPFQLILPWETPITAVYGQPLRGMVMGVRTEVSIARALDKGDLDPIQIHPLPVQQKILDAFAQIGFVFKSADLEYGQIAGVHQALPFYQEIEFFPAQQYAHVINEVELTFVTSPRQVDVILEFDKRGGLFSGGHDNFGRYTVSHNDAETTDWTSVVDGWVRQAVEHRQSAPQAPGHGLGYGQPAYSHHGHYQQSHGHGHGHGGGSGMGGVAMGVVGGLAAGYVAGEIMDEVFEDDEGED